MEHPVRTASCELLRLEESGRRWARGKCSHPWDCSKCPVMRRALEKVDPQTAVGWECFSCVDETPKEGRKLPGYYTGSGEPGLPPGCTRCGYPGQILQLVLRGGT